MTATLTALIVFGCLIVAVLVGRTLRGFLPEAHLSTESKDAVKLAMGLVATMSALVLGLLVSSAKGAYDTQRAEVIQMAAKVAFLDRLLVAYGPEAAEVRQRSAIPSRKGCGKCGPDKCAGRQTGVPVSKLVMLSTAPFNVSHHRTTCSRLSNRRPRVWLQTLANYVHCLRRSRCPQSRRLCSSSLSPGSWSFSSGSACLPRPMPLPSLLCWSRRLLFPGRFS